MERSSRAVASLSPDPVLIVRNFWIQYSGHRANDSGSGASVVFRAADCPDLLKLHHRRVYEGSRGSSLEF